MESDRSEGLAVWEQFVANSWLQSPTVLRDILVEPLATTDELWETLQAVSRHWRDGADVPLRFYLGRTLIVAGFEHMPAEEDTSLETYTTRLASLTGDAGYGLIVNDATRYHAGVYEKVAALLRALYAHTGFPVAAAHAAIFLGTYERTPFGVHVDGEQLFFNGVLGHKAMRVWPPGAFQGRRTDSSHDDAAEGSIVLDGGPRDLIYWPGPYDHVAEGQGLSASLSVSAGCVPPAAHLVKVLAKSVRESMNEVLGSDTVTVDPAGVEGGGADLPDIVEQAVATAVGGIAAPLRAALADDWLKRLSAAGLTSAPPAAALRPVDDDEFVCCDPRHPIVWRRDASMLVCAANGLLFRTSAHPHIVRLLEHLNRGEPTAVSALLSAFAGTAEVDGKTVNLTAQAVTKLLAQLKAMRALTCFDDDLSPT